MLTRLKHAVLVSGALLLPVTGAQAQFLSGGNISGCGGNNFIFCATWSAIAAGDSLTLTMTNTSNTVASPPITTGGFTDIGLGNIGTTDPTSFKFSGYGNWSLDNTNTDLNGLSIVENTFGGSSNPGNPAVNGLAPGQTVTFTFFWDSPVDASAFDTPQVGIHFQGGPNNCSSKALFNGNTGASIDGSTVSADCTGTVPEPSSVMLLGSALLGFAGTGVIRRRRR